MASFRWLLTIGFLLVAGFPSSLSAQEMSGVRPLRSTLQEALRSLPAETHVLLERAQVEGFLTALEGTPPEWQVVYGGGHHDSGHDDRLFLLNRERDEQRRGSEVLRWPVAFLWLGELSGFDEDEQGFRVALGPRVIETGWGFVRFKYEDLPGRLVALAGADTSAIREHLEGGEPIEVDVLLAGRLIPEESVIYDFSHEEEGRGMIMPVVRIEAVEYALRASRPAVRLP